MPSLRQSSAISEIPRSLRAGMKAGFDQARADASDLREDVNEGFPGVTAALTAISRQLDDVDTASPGRPSDLHREATERPRGPPRDLRSRRLPVEGGKARRAGSCSARSPFADLLPGRNQHRQTSRHCLVTVNVGLVLPAHGGETLVSKYETRNVPAASVALPKVNDPE